MFAYKDIFERIAFELKKKEKEREGRTKNLAWE